MRVASVCSSVGGLDLGLHRAGHETVFFCEFEPWRRKVLARHWPGVPVHHDLKELDASDVPECDLLVGGTPCQDLSIAGNRAGLDGERSGLFHAFAQLRIDLFDRYGCAWSLWENVAGALSSNDGRDFATVLASHVGADVPVPAGGWGGSGVVVGPWGAAEWRLLDAQFHGVPQRRRRVFVVGHLGAVHAPTVLADAPRGTGNSAARQGARQSAPAGPSGGTRVAGTLTTGGSGKQGWRIGADEAAANHVVAGSLTTGGPAQLDDNAIGGNHLIASALDTMRGGVDDNSAQARHVVTHTLTAHGFDASEDGTGRGTPVVAATLTAGAKARPGVNAAGRRQEDDRNVVAFHVTQDPISGPVSPALGVSSTGMGVQHEQGVRRLTPTECERLMGWPDGWTLDAGPSLVDAPQGWPSDLVSPVDQSPDGRRYSACGDGVVAHVAEWIGLGFQEVA